jgi:hypothetical protein
VSGLEKINRNKQTKQEKEGTQPYWCSSNEDWTLAKYGARMDTLQAVHMTDCESLAEHDAANLP